MAHVCDTAAGIESEHTRCGLRQDSGKVAYLQRCKRADIGIH